MSDLVLVTGVTGFLGGHVALHLLNKGYRVRGSLRDLARAGKVRDTLSRRGASVDRLEFVALDLLRDDGWDAAMEGVRYVQHVASPFVISMPKDPQALIRPAVEGTERALRAAFAADVERVVLTSSLAAVMYGHGQSRAAIFTDKDWTNLESPVVNAYARSKTLAEQRAWQLAEELGRRQDLAVINPPNIYGPLLDDDPGTSALPLMRLMRGDMPGVPRMVMPTADVRDIAAIHVEAMTDAAAGGNRVLISAGSISMLDMSNALREAFPQFAGKLPRRQLPDWFVRLYAMIDKDLRDNLGELVPERQMDAARARALLGRDFISARDAVVAMGRSIVEQKLV